MSNTLWWRPMIGAGTVSAPFADIGLPAIAGEDVAAVAADALLHDALVGHSLLLTGAERVTARQRVAILAMVLDRPLAFREQSEEAFRASRPGVPAVNLDYQVAMTGSPSPAEQEISPVVAAVTGREPMGFREWVSRHRDQLVSAAGDCREVPPRVMLAGGSGRGRREPHRSGTIVVGRRRGGHEQGSRVAL